MKLDSKYFTLDEMCATSHRVANIPSDQELANGQILVDQLDIIRKAWGSPIYVNSGYRCDKLNTLVGGSPTSSHRYFLAADLSVRDRSKNEELADLIEELHRKGLIKIDQLIREKVDKKGPSWVHYSPYNRKMESRKQIFST